MNQQEMTNRTVLVTGGARRLGAGIARGLHTVGMNVVIHCNKSRLEADQLCDQLNEIRAGSASVCHADLCKSSSYGRLIDQTVSEHGRLDVLVNNASAFYSTPVDTTTESEWEELFDTNLKAPFFLAQQAGRHLSEHQGCILNMVDIYGWRSLPNYSVYSTAKAGLIMMTQALARELAPDVRVNAIAPGAILHHPKFANSYKSQHPAPCALLPRWGEVEEIARAALFLIRDATYTTGAVLPIDGGRHMNPY